MPRRQQTETDGLATALANIRPRDQFKAPKYRGDSDVELFIQQFSAVSEANRWLDQQAIIHLRSTLEGPALDCGRESTLDGIFAALRARYGLTARQAKDRLTNLRRAAKQTLHEHATEVGRLVEVAFANLARADRDELIIDYFVRSLDNRALQRHMLAVVPVTLIEAVQASEEFLQVGGLDKTARPIAMAIEAKENDGSTNLESSLASISKVLEAQSSIMNQLAARLERLEAPKNGGERQNMRRPLACYSCGGPHLKRNCPHQKVTQVQASEQHAAEIHQGNGMGPTQQ